MRYSFIAEKEGMLYEAMGLIMLIGRELGTDFNFTLPGKNQQGLYVSEIEDAGWGNSLGPVVDFLTVADRMIMEVGSLKRAEVVSCPDVTFQELRRRYIRAAGPLWIRMGMCRIKDELEGEKFIAMDLAGSPYLGIISSLVWCMRGIEIIDKNKEIIKARIAAEETPQPIVEIRVSPLLIGQERLEILPQGA